MQDFFRIFGARKPGKKRILRPLKAAVLAAAKLA